MKGGFAKLWRKKEFSSHLISVIWDEAHYIYNWVSFCKDYTEAGHMCNLLLAPFLMLLVTMPDPVLNGMLSTLNMPCRRVEIQRQFNDHPNVYLTVWKIQHVVSSFKDLDILIPRN